MNKMVIETLVRFKFWANDRVLVACKKLSQEALTRAVTPDPGWGSLRGVLVHNLDTEFGWRTVLQPGVEDIILEESDFADVAALKTRWEEEKAAWLDFVDGLTEEDLENHISEDGPKVWQTILHVITHGIQHRAEAAMVLTGYGFSPGELDFAVFIQDRSDKV